MNLEEAAIEFAYLFGVFRYPHPEIMATRPTALGNKALGTKILCEKDPHRKHVRSFNQDLKG